MTSTQSLRLEADPLLTLAEMSGVLGVAERTPYQWRSRGVLPPPDDESVEDRPRWRRSRLLAWHEPRKAANAPGWRARVIASARAHTLPWSGLGDLARMLVEGEWIEGEDEGTEELVVRFIRPLPGVDTELTA